MKTNIAGIEFSSCIINASGPSDATLDELEIIANSDSAAIMMKSCTVEPRGGNEEPRYYNLPFGSIQCMGLPNLGYLEYIKFATRLKGYNKPIIASVAGLCIGDYRKMVQAFQNSDVHLIEVNVSCPNIKGKPVVAYDFVELEYVLHAVSNLGSKPIGLKLPAYLEFVHQEQVAELIRKYHISFISCINSIGNSLIINWIEEAPVIKPKEGVGSLCGNYIKPIALANVRNFYRLLKDEISIFGVGGVNCGTDAFKFLLCGADAVQVGTRFEEDGASCFGRISNELEELLLSKGYNSIDDVKGKLGA